MSVAARPLFAFDDSFVRELEGLYVPWQGAPVADREPAGLNEELAAELGADPEALRSQHGVEVLAGKVAPEGSTPVAQAYAGHQFGSYSPAARATAARCCSARSSTSTATGATCT